MAWVRIDDHAPEHPKQMQAGPEACWLWVRGLAYCSRYLTDGLIPHAVINDWGGQRTFKLALRLVQVGLWEYADHGAYQVHDYGEYQPSRTQVEARRERETERIRTWRERKGYAHGTRVHADKYDSTCPAPVPDPVPDPVPQEPRKEEPPPAATSPSELADAWNAGTTEPIPKCQKLSAQRAAHAKARLAERTLDDWRAIIARVEASAFCRGENDRGWVATFDWLIRSDETAVRVLEGKYDNREAVVRLTPRTVAAAAPSYGASWCDHDPRCASPDVHRLLLAREGAA